MATVINKHALTGGGGGGGGRKLQVRPKVLSMGVTFYIEKKKRFRELGCVSTITEGVQ